MKIEVPSLPYSKRALEPHISAQSLHIHYGRLQRGYINKLNSMEYIQSLPDNTRLESVINNAFKTRNNSLDSSIIYNIACQIWNHTYFFASLCQGGGVIPESGPMHDILVSSYGNVLEVKEDIKEKAKSSFGSTWLWVALTKDSNGVEVILTKDADLPWVYGRLPILCIDLWEHSYFSDYDDRKIEYIDCVVDNILNWGFAESNLKRYKSMKNG